MAAHVLSRNRRIGPPLPGGHRPGPGQRASAGREPGSILQSQLCRKCVPIASDVDCAGGGGNGPAYVRGPVRVVGEDIYKLDRDGDGIACDK